MSGRALPQIRRCNSCSCGLRSGAHIFQHTHARTHMSGLPKQRESIHQRLKTPTDARHYAKLPRPHVIIRLPTAAQHCEGHYAEMPPCYVIRLDTHAQPHTHTRTHACSMSVFGLLGYSAFIQSKSIQHTISAVWGAKWFLHAWGRITRYKNVSTHAHTLIQNTFISNLHGNLNSIKWRKCWCLTVLVQVYP